MAQNFRRNTQNNVGTSVENVYSADSYDTIVGIALTNVSGSSINVDCYINDGSNDIYLVKNAPIPVGSQLQLIDGGAKIILKSGDKLKAKSDTASSLKAIVSFIDAISS